jgi:protein SCO1/2
MKRLIYLILSILILSGCESSNEKLPYLGNKHIERNAETGTADTVFHTIADFSFINQDSSTVTNSTVADKIYVADFFFTSCPTICPIMKTQMLRVYEAIEDNPDVVILSHTIDPEYDTVGLLRDYAERLGVSTPKWHFLTGEKSDIYDLGQESYMVTTQESDFEPGGYIHSGAFILVDKKRRVRGMYDGTKEEAVNKLIEDIDVLLREYGS